VTGMVVPAECRFGGVYWRFIRASTSITSSGLITDSQQQHAVCVTQRKQPTNNNQKPSEPKTTRWQGAEKKDKHIIKAK